MFESIKILFCRILRIPPEPNDPFGAAGSVRVFRASINYFRYKLIAWILGSVAGLLGSIALCCILALAIFSAHAKGEVGAILIEAIVALVIVGGALFKVATGYFLVRLDYEMRWYKLSDRSLRIREGVFSVKEMTMTFANIQNISVSQGPLQRLFGIHDLKVESAGGGAMMQTAQRGMQDASAPHVAVFRGIDNPEEVQALMRERLKGIQDTGLGHPEEEHHAEAIAAVAPATHAAAASPADRIPALKEALSEAKALRFALESASLS